MANVKLIFNGTTKSHTNNTELRCYSTSGDEIYISIESDTEVGEFLFLDKSTAIKFHKELKKQISYIREEGKNE